MLSDLGREPNTKCFLTTVTNPAPENLLVRSTVFIRISWVKHSLSNTESTLFLLKAAVLRPHKMQCFRTISTTVTLLLLHIWKKSTRASHYLGWDIISSRYTDLQGESTLSWNQKEAGKHFILKTLLLRQLSTYFNILLHLKETGYRLCGRI